MRYTATCLLILGQLICTAGCATFKANPWPQIVPSSDAVEVPESTWSMSVDASLSRAKTDRRPVLIYWGADWCPPCNTLKSAVFEHPKFTEDTEGWVKIYIDGDSANAQKWGEGFKIVNYPTVLMLNAAGTEIIRFHETASYEEFSRRLHYTEQSTESFTQLIQKALGGEATESDWKVLVQGARDHYQAEGLYDELLIDKLVPILERCPRLDTIPCNALEYAIIAASFETASHDETALNALQTIAWLDTWARLVEAPERANHYASYFHWVPRNLISRLELFEAPERIAIQLPALMKTFHDIFVDPTIPLAQRHNSGLALYQLSKAVFPDRPPQELWIQSWFNLLTENTDLSSKRLLIPTLAKILAREGRDHEIEPLVNQFLSDDPTAWYHFYKLARSAVKREEYDVALTLLQKTWNRATGRSSVLQVVSRSATLLLKFPEPYRCDNLAHIQERWTDVLKDFSMPLHNRDKAAFDLFESTIEEASCHTSQ